MAMVRKAGLEPACLSAPPPQDGVSANSTTSALESRAWRLNRKNNFYSGPSFPILRSIIFIHGESDRFKASMTLAIYGGTMAAGAYIL